MQIQILCIGKIKDQWISEGISVFETRLRPYCSMTLTVLPEVRIPENASAAEENMVREKEGELLLSAVKEGYYTIALDPKGKMVSSEQLSAFIGDARISGRNLCFMIGGPLGFSGELLSSVREKISFSALTFTHTMCRLILFEQIYRAFRILSGEPYHK